MNEPLFMGIDGGGSALRIAIVSADLKLLASLRSGTANPSLIGRDAAQAVIRRGIAQILDKASLRPGDIAASGIGIAGASNLHSRDWLVRTVKPALPDSLLAPSSDLEIALIGALGRRDGILLLAGTGSAVYGIAPCGQHLQIGGWGYLLGDEGSGYWIGMQLLRRLIAQFDAGISHVDDPLTGSCLATLGLKQPRELIAWLYRSADAPASRIADLAELVLTTAASGEKWATDTVNAAAKHLVGQVDLMRSRLSYPGAPIACAGGLLESGNLLSTSVARGLGLRERPIAKYSPVIGAALLAKMAWDAEQNK